MVHATVRPVEPAESVTEASGTVNTEPLKLPQPVVEDPSRVFRLLTPDELTNEEIRSVQLQMTAFYYAQKQLTVSEYIEPPAPYIERFYIWKMIFRLLIPAGALVLTFVLAGLISGTGVIHSDAQLTFVSVLVFAVLICAWFAYRIFYSWQHTFLFSETQDTGIRRRRNRWLLLTEIDLAVETSSLKTKEASRGNFTSFFNLNSWRVSLDSPAQDDDFLRNIGFVRNGSELKKTINATQRYLNQ